jgi:hypothetical protein
MDQKIIYKEFVKEGFPDWCPLEDEKEDIE